MSHKATDQFSGKKDGVYRMLTIKSTKEGRKKYKDVYFIVPNACPASHEASVDGVHPDNYGYTLWAQSVEKKILKILAKYGIK